MSLYCIDDKSTLVQVMAWCRQATSHYLSQCWPRFLPPYSITRPQWVNAKWDLIPLSTHWGRVMHICIGKLTTTGSHNGLAPGQHQAIIWINAGIFLIGLLGTNFGEILIEILKFYFNKMHLEMSSGKWHPFCLGLNVLTYWSYVSFALTFSGIVMPYGDTELG